MELLKFIITITYFSFRGTIYLQEFGSAMGSLVSPVIASFFMEWLEQQAIRTVPVTCKPKLWKRYVDDMMAVVREGCEHEQTDHINSIDTTGSMTFTHEAVSNKSLPFLDTLMVRKEDGTVKFVLYRKKMHTEQYLYFSPSETGVHQNITG